jgi:RNA polymerase sigma factor (sigma-70 family)
MLASVEWSDADLLLGVRDGDDQAWQQLVKKYGGRMWAVARSYGLSTDMALDAVQMGWLKLLDHADQIRTPEALGAWLARVVGHEAIQISKERERQRERVEKATRRTRLDVEPPDVEILRQEDIARVAEVFERLSQRCQQLLRLMFATERMSYEEMADALGVPRGALGPNRARCLDKLRGLLQ